MYYEENLTQSEIAKKQLDVSRALICRLLNEARNYGIVTIQIHSPEEDSSLLKNQLKNSFKIEDVFIVKAPLGQTVTDEKNLAEDFSTILLKDYSYSSNIP